MDYFRRLHQSSLPPRPSPLGSSQESREDRPRSYGVPAHDPRRDDKPRPTGRYDYSSPTPTSSHTYSPAARSSNPQRGQNGGIQLSSPRNQSAHQHRRHASLESKSHPQTHRRNHSQPQSGHHRPGRQYFLYFLLCLSVVRVFCAPDSRNWVRNCPVVPRFSSSRPFLRTPAHVAEVSMDGGYHSTWHGGQAARHQASAPQSLSRIGLVQPPLMRFIPGGCDPPLGYASPQGA